MKKLLRVTVNRGKISISEQRKSEAVMFSCTAGLELCEPSLRLVATMLAGFMTVAGELLLLAVALGCQSWRGLLGAGAAPLTLFLSYGYDHSPKLINH